MWPEQPLGGGALHLQARAKVNLGLAVLGQRSDGFHEIDTLFARVELYDEIWLQRADGLSGELVYDAGLASEPGAPRRSEPGVLVNAPTWLEVGKDDLAMDESNLAILAARLYLDEAEGAVEGDVGVKVHLLKRIPLAAGLGGGSSDAAAVLLGMQRLFPADVDIHSLGARLGSDVPFFLQGACCARGRGRGDQLEPLDLPAVPIVLVNPGLQMSAASAFSAIDSFGPPLDIERIVSSLAAGAEPGWRNDLQPGVTASCPEVRFVLEAVAGSGLQGALMSGSGTSCFAVARDEAAAREAAMRVAQEHPDWFVWTGWAAQPGG